MKYLKLFEDFETEKKYSVSFDDKFHDDVIKSLKKANIRFEEKENIYFHLKKQVEIVAWVEKELDIIRAIPAWVKNLQVYKTK